MAKNSGVTASSESCCRALNEGGKLKLTGGNCKDKYPYICKYLFDELMMIPSELKITSQSWNSIEISWKRPDESWLPTFYNVRACAKTTVVECIVTEEIQSRWDFQIQNLKEFTNYELTVEALLKPVNIKTTAQTFAMTYPKLPVQCMISSDGEMKLKTPILVSMNKGTSVVKAAAAQSGTTMVAATGNVEEVLLLGFVPEESYQITIEEEGGEWRHEISLTAIPTCMKNDVSQDETCLRISEVAAGFKASQSTCSKEEQPMTTWSPKKLSSIARIVETNDITWNFWLDLSQMVEQETANLGQVSGLRPSFIGNTSVELQWAPPTDISWVIRRFEVKWSSLENPKELSGTSIAEETMQLIENLEFGTEYEIFVTPMGSKILRGIESKIIITTLDPRTQLSVTVQSNGIAKIYSPVLIEKGRGTDEVEVVVERTDPSNLGNTIISSKGKAEKVEISGLKLGAKYKVEMASVRQDSKQFKYETKFEAYPTCAENQIQEGMICVWASEEPKTWKEASEVCRTEQGELLDFETQTKFSPQVKSLLSSYVKEQFWVDVPNSIKSAAFIDSTADQCASSPESEVMCCTYEATGERTMNDLKCTCCSEPRPFACKRIAKIDLGNIGDIYVEEITTKSLSISWSMSSDSKWYKPSFVVAWQSTDERRRKRETKDEVVIEDPSVKIQGLTPGTKYKVAVAPYAEGENTDGNSKEIVVATRESKAKILFCVIQDSWCTMTILKISCSITVILGSCFTVFVFIATRVLFLDSLAQIFAELGTIGAYLCILVSTVQSYSIDDQCRTASPKLCVAVAVLIQFFFQSVFLFMLLESTVMAYALKDYIPFCCVVRSPISLMITGFGIPAIMTIVLAAIASDGFSDKSDNCWLDISGTAMLPSVIPVIIFVVFDLFLLLSLFDADDPKKELSPDELMRAKVYLKTRWGSFAILVLTTVGYGTGMIGANKRDSTLNSVFVGFSTALGILMPAIRIRCDDQVREELKHGLFNSLRDDLGAIRVTPAPDSFEPNLSIKMSELSARRHKHKHFSELALKNKQSYTDTEIAWHQ
ncbi:uncharacterized protein LOC129216555 [Uloborus diversus]|uniref:uncharacterized protein LOC129216555 n=1 Tax=Uloborus diversus TaxID=327109 RepID=UPI002409C82F|nr:uncharacterized protein LOC129216555 [Uloborus diversus]